MKTLADFKKRIAKGIKIETTYHQATTGHRDEKGKLRLFDEYKGIREINIVQATQFTLLTIKKDGTMIDSWLKYPKATECKILDDNTIMIMCEDFREHNSTTLIPLLTYKFI
jgi:hypothetical protein